MTYATNGQLPKDIYGSPAAGVYVPGVGTVAAAGSSLSTDSTGQPSAALLVQQNATQSVNATLQNAAAANGTGTAMALLGMASVIFTMTMAGFTGTVNFECTEDNVNYDPLQVQQEGTNLITTSVTGSTTTAIHLYEASVAGLQSVRARVSGFGAGTVTVTAHAIPTTDAPRAINAVNTDGQRATYSAGKQGLVVAASATDIATLTGSATKTIRVTHLEVSGIATTILETSVQVFVRTTADTAGASTAPTVVPHDQNSPAATAAMAVYTANPTVNDGTARLIRSQKVLFNIAAPAAGSESTRLVLDYGNRPSQALVLRGVAQQLAVNLAGVTVAGPSIDVSFEWTEDNS